MSDRWTHRFRRPRLTRWILGLGAIAALGAFSAGALAASGGSSGGSPGRPRVAFGFAIGGHAAQLSPQFRDCMKAHGIQAPPGPPPGEKQTFQAPPGPPPGDKQTLEVQPGSPAPAPPKDLPDPQKLQQALSACKQYLPADAQQKLAQMQAFQQCLSSHGVTPPLRVRVPEAGGQPPDPQKLQQAFSACKQYLPADAQVKFADAGKLRQCLSDHGVKGPEAGGQPPSPDTLKAAFEACRQYAPKGMADGPGAGKGGVVFMSGQAPGPPPPGSPPGAPDQGPSTSTATS